VFCAAAYSASNPNASTYVGDDKEERVAAIAKDALGNTYLTGIRYLDRVPHFPPSTSQDLFVIKENADGNVAFIVGAGGPADYASAIAADPAGNIYVAGSTSLAPGSSGLLIKLNTDGNVIYSKHFVGITELTAVATDADGNVYIAGSATGTEYPHTAGLPYSSGSAAFFAKISGASDQIVYAGAIGGTKAAYCIYPGALGCAPQTAAAGIAVDAQGTAYVIGNTNTTDLPITEGVFQPQGVGAFVARIRADGTGLAYLTYLDYNLHQAGYGWPTTATAIAVDAAGNAYITGATSNTSFPVTANAYQTGFRTGGVPAAPVDLFVVKLRPDGKSLVWGSYFGDGGEGGLVTGRLAVEPSGRVWLSGYTRGGPPYFLVQFDSTGSTLLYSLPNSPGYPIALDPNGTVHIASGTPVVTKITADAPLDPLIAGIAAAGSVSAAEGLIVPAEVISIYGAQLGLSGGVAASPDNSGAYPTSLGGVQVIIGGIPAPLLYVSEGQINAVTPVGLTAPGETHIQIVRDKVATPAFRAVVMPGLPFVFHAADGNAVVNADGTVNSIDNPAKIGSVVSVWATGTRPLKGVDGRIATAANNNCSCSVQLGDILYKVVDAEVLYCGDAPGLVFGVTQVNVRIPGGVTSTSVGAQMTNMYLSAGGVSTGSGTTLYVAP
jgi:uncharacterized protein (TIGR03437 family)